MLDLTLSFRDKHTKIQQLHYAVEHTTFGNLLLAGNAESLVFIGFEQDNLPLLLNRIKQTWLSEYVIEDCSQYKGMAERILTRNGKFNLLLKAEGFFSQVLIGLSSVSYPISYKSLAEKIGRNKAVRASGTAVGKNPISLLLPCHRIITSSGQIGQYAYGSDIKKALLDFEKANNLFSAPQSVSIIRQSQSTISQKEQTN